MSRFGDDKKLAEYILGRLPGADEALLEAGYLSDSHLQEQLLLIEDELVDAYVQGSLAKDERAQLEARFLASPRGRRKLELANSLTAFATKRQLQEGPGARPEHATSPKLGSVRPLLIRRVLAAAATLMFVLALGWSFRNKLFYRPNAERSRAGGQETKPQMPPDATIGTSPSPGTAMVSVFLRPISRSVDRAERTKIPADAREVNFELDVGAALHDSYRVALVNAQNQVKWTGGGLNPRLAASGKTVSFSLPSSLFEPGEYTLLLSSDEHGAPPIAEYVVFLEKPTAVP